MKYNFHPLWPCLTSLVFGNMLSWKLWKFNLMRKLLIVILVFILVLPRYFHLSSLIPVYVMYFNCLYVLFMRLEFCDRLDSLYYDDDDGRVRPQKLSINLLGLTYLEICETVFKMKVLRILIMALANYLFDSLMPKSS